MRRLLSFLVEMRRRRVFRVVGVYIVGAWATLQVVDLAFSSWGVPASALQYLWIAAAAGLPITAYLGWRFDLVGHRIIRFSQDGIETDIAVTRTDIAVIAALAAVIISAVYGVSSEILGGKADGGGPSPVGPDARALAVLPFETNAFSGEKVEFLALGLQDDLLTRIARVDGLKVISRTSVERYRGTQARVAEIGRELGVRNIVEGRVQRAGDVVRINVQLIVAQTDEHLWAGTYDLDVDANDLFPAQSKIVETIARNLVTALSLEQASSLGTVPTASLEAYTEYLKGRQQANLESVESLNEAVAHYKNAIDLDPEFSLAHVGLADAYLTLGANFYEGLPKSESIALAEPPLAIAMSREIVVPEAYATLGLLEKQRGNLAAAEGAYLRAIELVPNYSYAHRMYARLLWERGERELALDTARKALDLDPFYAPVNYDIARYSDLSGNFDEALFRYLRVVEANPDYAFAYVYIAAIYYLVFGQVDESVIWYQKAARSDALSPSLKSSPALALIELGDLEGARYWVDLGRQLGPDTFWTLWSGLVLSLSEGDQEAAAGLARQMLEQWPRSPYPTRILRDFDVAAGRYDVARARYARLFRELFETEVPSVDIDNYRAAVDLALVLQKTNEPERADVLLDKSLEVIRTIPRLGTDGYWVTDACIYALQSRPDQAIAALRTATDEGWRFLTWYFLDRDPCLESLRGLPEFISIRDLIQEDLTAQRQRLEASRASGEVARIERPPGPVQAAGGAAVPDRGSTCSTRATWPC